MASDEEKKAAREKIQAEQFPTWAKGMDKLLETNGTGWAVGESMTVADVQGRVVASTLTSGLLDHWPTDCFDAYPNIKAWATKFISDPKWVEFDAIETEKLK